MQVENTDKRYSVDSQMISIDYVPYLSKLKTHCQTSASRAILDTFGIL